MPRLPKRSLLEPEVASLSLHEDVNKRVRRGSDGAGSEGAGTSYHPSSTLRCDSLPGSSSFNEAAVPADLGGDSSIDGGPSNDVHQLMAGHKARYYQTRAATLPARQDSNEVRMVIDNWRPTTAFVLSLWMS